MSMWMLESDHLVFQFCCKASCHKPRMKSIHSSSSNYHSLSSPWYTASDLMEDYSVFRNSLILEGGTPETEARVGFGASWPFVGPRRDTPLLSQPSHYLFPLVPAQFHLVCYGQQSRPHSFLKSFCFINLSLHLQECSRTHNKMGRASYLKEF